MKAIIRACLITLPLVLVSLLQTGCTAEGQKQNVAKLRVFNAVFESAPLRVTNPEGDIVTQLAEAALSGYKEIASGSQLFTTFTGTSTKVAEATYLLGPESRVTMIVAGTVTGYASALFDDSIKAPGDGKTRVRFIHMAAGTDGLDMYLTPASTDIASVSATAIGTVYGTTLGFQDLDVGTYVLRFTPTATKEVIYESAPVTLTSKQIVSFVAHPTGSNKLVNISQLAIDDASTGVLLPSKIARFKVANAISGAAIKVKVDGIEQVESLATASLSIQKSAGSGTRQFRIEPVATPGTALVEAPLTFSPGRDYTVLATGSGTAASIVALPVNSQSPNAAVKVRLRVINGVSGGGDATLLINSVSTATIAVKSASSYIELDAGTYNLTLASAAGAVLFSLPAKVFATEDVGKVFAIFLTGEAGNVQGALLADD